jgi:hypothetical protein
MLRRTLILVTVLVAAALCSWPAAAASDPQAKKAAADPHAAKKVATETHASKTATAEPQTKIPSTDSPASKKGKTEAQTEDVPRPLATDLHAVNDRIQERLAEVRKAQAAKSSSGARAAASRREAPVSSRPAAPRVELVWRPSVTWPQELQSGEKTAAAPVPLASERVAAARGPQP